MLFQNGSISGSMATKEDARQPGNPGTLNKNCLNSGPRCHMHNIIHVLRSIKCIHFFLNHRPFLKFPERQKALHSLLLPDSLQMDAISTASSIRCRTRGWFAFDPASFCEKNSDLIVRAVFRSRPLKP